MSAPLRICNLVLQATSAPAADLLPLDNNAYASTKRVTTAALIGSRVLAGNVLYVDKVNGSDSTGASGSIGYPFLTLGAAKTAAVAGNTVRVYPGTYNERDLLKNGVNWDFMPGASVNYTGSANGGIFDDSSDGANGAVTCSITGAGSFTHNGTGGAADRNSCIRVTNTSSVISIECRNAIGSATGAFNQAAVRHSAGSLYLRCDEPIVGTGLNYGAWWTAGESHIIAPQIQSAGVAAVYVTATGSDNQWITTDKITGQNGIEVASGNSNTRVFIDSKEVRGAGIGMAVNACKVYLNCEKISAADQPFFQNGGELWLNGQKLTLDSGASSAQIAGGFASIELQEVEDLGCGDVCLDLAAVGVSVTCKVGLLKTFDNSNGSTAALRLNQSGGGRCAFHGLVDASLMTAGNPVTIPASGTGTLLNGTTLIANGTRESIVPDSGSATVNIYGVAYTTHAKNASVTIGKGVETVIAGMT